MWTNTLCNLDKYILQFGQIHFAIQTVARYNFCPDTVFQFCLHLSRTVKHIWVGPKNIALSSKQCQINCLQYFIGLSQFVERFLKCSNWKYFRYPAATIVIHHELQGAKFPLKNDAAASFNWSNVKLWYYPASYIHCRTHQIQDRGPNWSHKLVSQKRGLSLILLLIAKSPLAGKCITYLIWSELIWQERCISIPFLSICMVCDCDMQPL